MAGGLVNTYSVMGQHKIFVLREDLWIGGMAAIKVGTALICMATANVVKMESFLRLEREAVNIAPIHVLRGPTLNDPMTLV